MTQSQRNESNRTLDMAIWDLEGQWFGTQADCLFYDQPKDVYVFGNPDAVKPENGVSLVSDFTRYRARLGVLNFAEPLNFNCYLVPKSSGGLFGSSADQINVAPDAFKRPSNKQGEHSGRVAFLQQTDDLLLVKKAIFQDSYLQVGDQTHRITTVPPSQSGLDLRQETHQKKSTLLANGQNGLTPWSIDDLRKSVILPEHIGINVTYSNSSTVLTAELVDKESKQVLLSVNHLKAGAMMQLELAVSKFALKGDVVSVDFQVPAGEDVVADQDGVEHYRVSTVNIDAVQQEIAKSLSFYVEDSLAAHQVDGSGLHAPLFQRVSQSQTPADDFPDDVSRHSVGRGIVRKDDVNITVALHPSLIASKDLAEVVRDAVFESTHAPKDVDVTCTLSAANAIKVEEISQKLTEEMRSLRIKQPGMPMEQILITAGSSVLDNFKAVFDGLHNGAKTELLNAMQNNRTVAANAMATLIVAEQGFSSIADTLPRLLVQPEMERASLSHQETTTERPKP